MILSHAVDEVEDFEPVQKKPQLDIDKEPDGMCLISGYYPVAMLSSIIVVTLYYS